MPSNQVFSRGFFRDRDLDYETRVVLGAAVHGASEIGEVLATVDRVEGRVDWRRQWTQTARRARVSADSQRSRGDARGAGMAYLRAATYWACVVDDFAEGDDSDGLRQAFEAHRECWDAFVDSFDGAHVRVDVPYEGTTLPGYLLRPDASGALRPTLVLTNGSDAAISAQWSNGAAGALARGWNAFVYDGPGQQSMLFERGVPFRPDWEAVLTPVVDTLVARPDVDAGRLMAYGVSQGGYWVPRALAYEHRFVAAVADPGVVDVSTRWMLALGSSMRGLLDRGERAAFNRDMRMATLLPGLRRTLTYRSRPYGSRDDWFDLFSEVRTYALDDETLGRITTPVLVTNPEGEQFWPGQPEQLAKLLGDRAELVDFTAAEGANLHCQPLARQLTDERMFGWLTTQLPR
ncbi:prolyl oligopeptidase family serine peptidase [Phytohabitans sp. ZYX-F-186]|uniref:Prolyl oligopeptidase family serine peptidase n=1 Tax=Phytohabitans maris TaxID=3071409 RepID=A0ABU0ZCT3_9ACTN|nr:prolyl oligopeptidase family serine peptidase [Phytohabitans sp. ZYX-F-186]MDQ7904778.1 prolyl oligopeptidase family serine peptidase [Phytohabitans sp. ZYX-F-186]